jgi:hypothetical protein
LLLAAALIGEPTAAQTSERRWHATGYVSRWVNTDLLEVPARAATGDLALFRLRPRSPARTSLGPASASI